MSSIKGQGMDYGKIQKLTADAGLQTSEVYHIRASNLSDTNASIVMRTPISHTNLASARLNHTAAHESCLLSLSPAVFARELQYTGTREYEYSGKRERITQWQERVTLYSHSHSYRSRQQ